jgi:hypothetical protein
MDVREKGQLLDEHRPEAGGCRLEEGKELPRRTRRTRRSFLQRRKDDEEGYLLFNTKIRKDEITKKSYYLAIWSKSLCKEEKRKRGKMGKNHTRL